MTGADGKIRELQIIKRGRLRERGFLNTKKCPSSASGNIGRFPFNQNVRKFGNSGKWYKIFPGKVSRKSENCSISKKRTIQRKILEIPGAKLNGKKNPGKFFRKFEYTLRGCPPFWEFWEMLFLSLQLEVAENSKQTFWLNGKCPLRYSRNKINCFPRDQSLSVYYYPLTSQIPAQKLLAGTSLLDIRELQI